MSLNVTKDETADVLDAVSGFMHKLTGIPRGGTASGIMATIVAYEFGKMITSIREFTAPMGGALADFDEETTRSRDRETYGSKTQ